MILHTANSSSSSLLPNKIIIVNHIITVNSPFMYSCIGMWSFWSYTHEIVQSQNFLLPVHSWFYGKMLVVTVLNC